ncbi:MAG: hypothetical protein MZW92_11535 [Comamonadaceae bacterium]|nr:hypothetical protein [Comamonadaceae bacterium]
MTHWSDKRARRPLFDRHSRAALGALGQPDLDRVCQPEGVPDLRLARARRHQVRRRAGGGDRPTRTWSRPTSSAC